MTPHEIQEIRNENKRLAAEVERLREVEALVAENTDLEHQLRRIEEKHRLREVHKERQTELEAMATADGLAAGLRPLDRDELHRRACRIYGKPAPSDVEGRPTSTSRPTGTVLMIRSSTPPATRVLDLREARRLDRTTTGPAPLPPLDREALSARAKALYGHS